MKKIITIIIALVMFQLVLVSASHAAPSSSCGYYLNQYGFLVRVCPDYYSSSYNYSYPNYSYNYSYPNYSSAPTYNNSGDYWYHEGPAGRLANDGGCFYYSGGGTDWSNC